jgi:hypothetical protein
MTRNCNQKGAAMTLGLSAMRSKDFDPEIYIRILIATCKSDRSNGEPEMRFVRARAQQLGLDFDQYWESTDKAYSMNHRKVSRRTALNILKDSVMLATLDRNYTLQEKERVYTYAEKLDLPRSDVDALHEWIEAYHRLKADWQDLVAGGDD